MTKRLLLLNGLAILGVVLYHASGWGFTALFWWTHRYRPVEAPNFEQMGSLSYYGLRVIEQLIIFSVPAFLFVSGIFIAFTAGRSRSQVPWKLLATRLGALLIPYLLWSLVLFGLDRVEGKPFRPETYLPFLLTGRAAAPYYFVPLLVQLYLLSSVIVPLVKRHWKLALAIAAALQLTVRALIYADTLGIDPGPLQPLIWLTPNYFFPGHLFWFTAGVVAGLHLKAFDQFLQRTKRFWLALMLALFPLGILEWEWILQRSTQDWIAPRETILDSIFAASFILAFLAHQNFEIPHTGQVAYLGSKSYGIYLVHSPVMELGARVIYFAAPWLLPHQILFQPILIALGLGVPLLLMSATGMQRSPVRATYRYIFG